MQKLFIQFAPIGLIAHRQIEPRLFIHDRLIAGEGMETVLAVIRAHTALAHTAKAHGAGGKVDHHVVDAYPYAFSKPTSTPPFSA